jgi:hypothetical protein
MWITPTGDVYSGQQPPRSIFIVDRPSAAHKLKTNWREVIPDVWEFDIEAARVPLRMTLFRECEKKLNEILSYYPKGEDLTWSDKAPLAKQWLALSSGDKTANKTNLDYVTLFTEATGKFKLANASDITAVTELATRITTNKAVFGAFAGAVLKIKTTALSAINAATTLEALQAITYDFDSVTYESIVEGLS